MTDDKPCWPKCCDKDMSWLPDDIKYHCAKCGLDMHRFYLPKLPNLSPEWEAFCLNYCACFPKGRDRDMFLSLLELYDRCEDAFGLDDDLAGGVGDMLDLMRTYRGDL